MSDGGNISKSIKILFLVAVVLILTIPSAILFLSIGVGGVSLGEQRSLASFPRIRLSTPYAREFDEWFTDNFGFRSSIIFWNSDIKLRAFNSAMNPQKAMAGKDGWLFYNNSTGADYIFKSYTHRNLFSETDFEELTDKLLKREAYCDSAGIKYIKGYYPQTQTIYPEKLPWQMEMQIVDTLSRGDQFKQFVISRFKSIAFVDFKDVLLKEKEHNQIYKKLDTHWNDLGAFSAYQYLFNSTYDLLGVRPRKLEEYKLERVKTGGGGLRNMMGQGGQYYEELPILTPGPSVPKYSIEWSDGGSKQIEGYPPRTWITICDSCADKRTVLVFKDSYTEAMEKFFSTHFYKIIYLHWGYNQEYVKRYRPDIIIDIPVERYLLN